MRNQKRNVSDPFGCHGQDTVNDYDWVAGNVDTVRMAEGIVLGNVTLTRDYSNLYVSLNNGADRLTLQNWFSGTLAADTLFGGADDDTLDGGVTCIGKSRRWRHGGRHQTQGQGVEGRAA